MKTTVCKKSAKQTPTSTSVLARAPRTPAKPKPGTDPVPPNPETTEMEGGRKGGLHGRFEADHRPSR